MSARLNSKSPMTMMKNTGATTANSTIVVPERSDFRIEATRSGREMSMADSLRSSGRRFSAHDGASLERMAPKVNRCRKPTDIVEQDVDCYGHRLTIARIRRRIGRDGHSRAVDAHVREIGRHDAGDCRRHSRGIVAADPGPLPRGIRDLLLHDHGTAEFYASQNQDEKHRRYQGEFHHR